MTATRAARSFAAAPVAAALLVGATLALAACVTAPRYGASVEADATRDFAAYRTYAFPENAHSESTSLAYSPQLVSRTQALFARRLEAEGLRRVFTEREADLVVSYGISAQSGTDVRIVPMAWSRGHDTNVRLQSMDQHGMHDGSYDQVRVDTHHAGMMVLDLWDNRAGKVVWRAWITGEIVADRNDNFSALDEALVQAFAQYPPQPKAE
jgi:hypothetical protein